MRLLDARINPRDRESDAATLRRQHLRIIGVSVYNTHRKKVKQVVRHVSEQMIGIANAASFQQVLQGYSLSSS